MTSPHFPHSPARVSRPPQKQESGSVLRGLQAHSVYSPPLPIVPNQCQWLQTFWCDTLPPNASRPNCVPLRHSRCHSTSPDTGEYIRHSSSRKKEQGKSRKPSPASRRLVLVEFEDINDGARHLFHIVHGKFTHVSNAEGLVFQISVAITDLHIAFC